VPEASQRVPRDARDSPAGAVSRLPAVDERRKHSISSDVLMSIIMEKPRIRPVEAFPAEYEGRPVIALRDPQGYTEGMVFVPQEALALLGLFDGEHTVLDIQEAYMRQYGQLLFSEQIHQLIRQLDAYHLLDSPAFTEYRASVEAKFRSSKVRRASHAGVAYEEEPEALRRQLDALFSAPGGPGAPEAALRNGPLKGLVAPHIDLLRGGTAYAHAYKAFAEAEPAELYIVLGVAHAGSQHPFILTRKDFETPLGRVKTDVGFVQRLQARCTQDLLADEIAHKIEHSIEFQLLFLQHLSPEPDRIAIVPILVGSFREWVEGPLPPKQHPAVSEFIEALRETLQEEQQRRRRVCLIAGVDLSHVGHRFGDPQELTPKFLSRVKREDERFLRHVTEQDAASLLRMICEEKDWRKVCGFPALYTFLQVLPKSRAELLDYQQWSDPPSGCSVSFASLAFR